MKYSLSIFILSLILVMSSCSKDKDPVLEISIKTLPSQNWKYVEYRITDISFIENENNQISISDLQQWNSVDLNPDLRTEENNLIANDNHWELNLAGMKLHFYDFRLQQTELSGAKKVTIPYVDYVPLPNKIQLENGKTYQIEITFDFDKLIYEDNGEYFLDHNYSIQVSEI